MQNSSNSWLTKICPALHCSQGIDCHSHVVHHKDSFTKRSIFMLYLFYYLFVCRLDSLCLSSCSRGFSEYTTVTGLTQFRKLLWKLALKSSQTSVWYYTEGAPPQKQIGVTMYCNQKCHAPIHQALTNLHYFPTQLRAEPSPSRWIWTVRWTTCLSSPTMSSRRASSTGNCQQRPLPDEIPQFRPPKTTET